MNESQKNILIKKLHYKSTHRGSKENDLILGKFAAKFLPDMNENELIEYARFLDETDENIFKWLTKKHNLSQLIDSPLMQKLLNFSSNYL